MIRADERTAWNGFLGAEPRFAGEDIAAPSDGPDPPDFICTTASGKIVGVELTKWIENAQITASKKRESFENSYLKIVASENEPRPDRIGQVSLYPKTTRVKPAEKAAFRSELFALLRKENATPDPPLRDSLNSPPTPVPVWNTPQGAPIRDFTGFPTLAKYLDEAWVLPRERFKSLPSGEPWVVFELPGGSYTHEWMVQAAIDRIKAKIDDYKSLNLHGKYKLAELHLLCCYCDEAVLYNTPIDTVGFGFADVASRLAQMLVVNHGVFNRIFIYSPYEVPKVIRVYPAS
jgi:hypothetical protein